MKITFVSNFFNHHQLPTADCLYEHLGEGYHFIETMPPTDEVKRGGYPQIERPYVIKTHEDSESLMHARQIIDESDVVVLGAASNEWIRMRRQENKVTFHYTERWLKRGDWLLLDPRRWISTYKNHTRYRKSRLYLLCASGFTARDAHAFLAYRKKCFKWGYFTAIPQIDIQRIVEAKRAQPKIRILYVARFLKWKRPYLAVKLAQRLKSDGYDFELNMYGSGAELENTKKMIGTLGLDDKIKLCGNKPNAELMKIMQQHHILIFTSNREEGWGAVAGEAMSNGCAVVASNSIGCVPFLIKPKVTGLSFKSGNLNSLYSNVKMLIDDVTLREDIATNAYKWMHDVWSPSNAAKKFIELCESLCDNNVKCPEEGPCSKA